MKQYLDLLQDILDNGTTRVIAPAPARYRYSGASTGTAWRTAFLLTTKKLHLKSIVNELIWFLNGGTNTRWLKENGVSIWDEWATEDGTSGRSTAPSGPPGPRGTGAASTRSITWWIACATTGQPPHPVSRLECGIPAG